jgi:hypothetical protein
MEIAQHLWTVEPGWLNTASYGLPPKPAWDALQLALADWRRGSTSWEPWDAPVNRARASFARLIGVPEADVAIGAQVSQLLAPIAAAVPDGGTVLLPDIEFTSNVFPWAVHGDRGVTVRTAPPAKLAERIDESVDVVAFALVQSATGEIVDYPAVVAAARAAGALVVVDATQATGWYPYDGSLADAVVNGAYKWLMAPRGTGFAYLSPASGPGCPRLRHLARLAPLGGHGARARGRRADRCRGHPRAQCGPGQPLPHRARPAARRQRDRHGRRAGRGGKTCRGRGPSRGAAGPGARLVPRLHDTVRCGQSLGSFGGMKVQPAAGGGRWAEISPHRLAGWLDGFYSRHEGVVETGLLLCAANGDTAQLFPPPGLPKVQLIDEFLAAIKQPRRLGLLLARKGAAAVGVTEGDELVASKVERFRIHGRTAAGGWSQQRYARRRANQAAEGVKETADIAERVLLPHASTLDALVCGGDRATIDAILADPRLAALVPLRHERLLDVPEPRQAVLLEALAAAKLIRIRLNP